MRQALHPPDSAGHLGASRRRHRRETFCEGVCPISSAGYGKIVTDSLREIRKCYGAHNATQRHVCSLLISGSFQDPYVGRNTGVDRRWVQWIQEGMYADSLGVWQAQYGRENVLALRYEDLLASPRAQLSRIFNHVGVGTQHLTEEIWAAMERDILGTKSRNSGQRAKVGHPEAAAELIDEATYRELSDFYPALQRGSGTNHRR